MLWMTHYDNICDIFVSFLNISYLFFLKKIVVIFTRKRKFSNWIFGPQFLCSVIPILPLTSMTPTPPPLALIILIDDSESHSDESPDPGSSRNADLTAPVDCGPLHELRGPLWEKLATFSELTSGGGEFVFS